MLRILLSLCIGLILASSAYALTPSEWEAQHDNAYSAYYTQKDAGKSEQMLQALLSEAPASTVSNQARLLLGEIYFDTQRFSEARDILADAQAFHYPDQSAQNLLLEAAVFKQAGLVEKVLLHFDIAEQDLSQGLAIYQQHWPQSEEMGNLLVELGNVYLKEKKLVEAKDSYSKAQAI